jgi:hypothetical protein
MPAVIPVLPRDRPIEASRSALIVIDVQNWALADQARLANAISSVGCTMSCCPTCTA